MFFDKLCRAAEQMAAMGVDDGLDAEVIQLLRKASLFVWDQKDFSPTPLNPSLWTESERELAYRLAMPFDTIAIEHPFGCTLIRDSIKGQSGMSVRFFAVYDCWYQHEESKQTFSEKPEGIDTYKIGVYVNGTGEVSNIDEDKNIITCKTNARGYVYCEDGTIHEAINEDAQKVLASTVAEAYEQVRRMNTPERFVVECIPRKIRGETAMKIPRSHERSNFTIITPDQIRQRCPALCPACETGSKKCPHPRRRHLRHLSHECWTSPYPSVVFWPVA